MAPTLLDHNKKRPPSVITTRPFSTTSGDYLSVLLGLWLPRYGWTVAVPLIACAAIGFMFDERFLLIALMLLFIVVPMLISFLYTYYMLTPEARRAVVRKQVEIDEGRSLHLVYLKDEKPAEESGNRDANRRELLPIASEAERQPLPEPPLPSPETIPWSDVSGVKSGARFKIFLLKGPRLNFLLIPWEALRQ